MRFNFVYIGSTTGLQFVSLSLLLALSASIFAQQSSNPFAGSGQSSSPIPNSSPFNLGGSRVCRDPDSGQGFGTPTDGSSNTGDGGTDGGSGEGKTSCAVDALTTQANQIPALGTANPINVLNGNKYKRQSDMASLSGELSLEFVRHYNSQFVNNLELGVGWSHSYSVRINASQGLKPSEQTRVRLVQADGRTMLFERPNSATNQQLNLSKEPSSPTAPRQTSTTESMRSGYLGDGELITSDIAYNWHWPNGRVLSFDERGFLSGIKQGALRFKIHRNHGGNLSAVTDAQGRRMAFRYEQGYLASMLVNGEETFYQYSRNGQLLQVTRPDGRKRKYQYDSEHSNALLTSIIDERGVQIAEYRYNAQKQAVYSAQANGVEAVEVAFEEPVYKDNKFDSQRKTRVTNTQGGETVYHIQTLAGKDRVVEVSGVGCAACAQTGVKYKYNKQLLLTQKTNQYGLGQAFDYDKQGRLLKKYQLGRDGQRELLASYDYKENTNKPFIVKYPSVKPGEFVTTRIEYTANGKIKNAIAKGFVEHSLGVFEPVERQLEYRYTARGNLQTIKLGGQLARSLQWDKDGLLSETIEANGNKQRIISRNKYGQVTAFQVNNSPTVKISYTTQGKLKTVLGGEVDLHYHYDLAGYLLKVVGDNSAEVRYEYDDSGRMVKKYTSKGQLSLQWSKENTLLERRFLATGAKQAEVRRYQYDDQRQLSSITNEQGESIKTFSRNADPFTQVDGIKLNDYAELTESKEGGITREFTRVNGASRIKKYTDPKGGSTQYGYDDFGNLSYIHNPDSGLSVYQRTDIGQLAKKTDARGLSVSMAYGQGGGLKTLKYLEQTVNIDYNDDNLLSNIHTARGTEKRQYNKQQRLTRLQQNLKSPEVGAQQQQFIIDYEYDEQGRIVAKALAGGETLSYRYHEAGPDTGQLQAIELKGWLWNTPIISDLHSQLKKDQQQPTLQHQEIRYRLGEHLQAAYHRDNGNLRKLSYKNSAASADDQAYGYLYNKQAQIIGIDQNQRPFHRYRYNDSSELDFAMTPKGLYGYQYDSNGNRSRRIVNGVAMDTEYSASSNRLTKMNVADYDIAVDYHTDGSLGRLGNLALAYDNNGQLASVRLHDSQKLLANYRYNPRGERIAKTYYDNNKQAHTRHYLYEQKQLIAEADEQGAILRQYVYAGKAPIAVVEGGKVYSVQSNHLGAPTAVFNPEGKKIWQAYYAPFGQASVESDPDGDLQHFEFNIRLPGQYHDAESKLHYNYYRYYDPASGRYISSDPIGLNGGPNTYAYVKNDPVHYIDPLGLLLFAFDGTGNHLQTGPETSNVVHFRNNYIGPAGELSTTDGDDAHSYYITGIGTHDTDSGQDNGAWDAGLALSYFDRVEIMTGYFAEYLSRLENAGRRDETVHLDFVGFSRGASTARTFGNIVDGIIEQDYSLLSALEGGAALEKRFTEVQNKLLCSNIEFNLRFMGLFDTVPHYGFFQFNDLRQVNIGISDNFDKVSHAMAVNEDRYLFDAVSIHQNEASGNSAGRTEQTFLGAHADIGGGYREGDLSDIALMWIVAQAKSAGVSVNDTRLTTRERNKVDSPVVHNSVGGLQLPGRDIKYLDGSEVDADDWNTNGQYGITREQAETFFDDRYKVFRKAVFPERCASGNPVPNDDCRKSKGVDGEGNTTLVGAVINNNPSVSDYQQWLNLNYSLDVQFTEDELPNTDEKERKKDYEKQFGE